MPLFSEVFSRLRYLVARRRVDRELGEEIRLHIEERAKELAESGIAEVEAFA